MRSSPFPVSHAPPAASPNESLVDVPSEVRFLPLVALAVDDPVRRDRFAALFQAAGLLVAGENLLPSAAVVVAHATSDVRALVSTLRATARSDAAIIVVLDRAATATEGHAAHDAGALMCVREPLDEDSLVAAIRAAMDLHGARARAHDLERQLDLQTHLAAVGRVTANFTHELSNPLTVVTSSFEFVAEQITETAAMNQDVADALASVRSALDRIRDLLAIARSLSRDKPSSALEAVDLASVVRDVRQWTAAELEGVAVLELVDEPITARADRRMLEQVVVNLVTNAAHAAKQLPSPRVRLHVYGSREVAILSVRDNGPGISDETRDRVFEPFFTTRRDQGGTGLGLALCREYAERMGAKLTFWSAPGRGACFRILLRRE